MGSKELKRPSFSLSIVVHDSTRGSASAREGSELSMLFLDMEPGLQRCQMQDPMWKTIPVTRAAPIQSKKIPAAMFLLSTPQNSIPLEHGKCA